MEDVSNSICNASGSVLPQLDSTLRPTPEGCWTVAGGQASVTSDTPGSRRSAIHPGWGDGVAPQFFAIATAQAPLPGCAPFFTEPGVSLVTLAQPPASLRQPSGLPCRVAAATTIAVGDEEREPQGSRRQTHGSSVADGPRSGQTTSVPFPNRAPSCSTATRSMSMPMIRGLKPTATFVAAATRQFSGRVARQDSCRRVACATTQHRSDLANP